MPRKPGIKYEPSEWKIKCDGENCKEYVIFDNYNNFQNAKTRVKHGQKALCECCKESKIKYSKNPEDWKVNCTMCGEVMVYDNFASFLTISVKIRNGHFHHCPTCIKKHKKNGSTPMYSRNKEDWKLPCGNPECDRIKVYTSLKGYMGAAKLFKEGKGMLCFSCVAKRKIDVQQYPAKCEQLRLKREMKADAGNQYDSFTNDELMVLRRDKNITMKIQWVDISIEERSLIIDWLNENTDRLIEKYKQETKIIRRNSMAKRLVKVGGTANFKPVVNEDSIPFIDNELSNIFSTKFVHGHSDDGEYRIYDPIVKTCYFADAYSAELNLWIEIDEKDKFYCNSLKDKHIFRHQRIKSILNCNIVRFKHIKHQNSFIEYYNDLVGFDVDNLSFSLNSLKQMKKVNKKYIKG